MNINESKRQPRGNLMKLNKATCKMLHMDQNNPSTNTDFAENVLKTVLRRKLQGVHS